MSGETGPAFTGLVAAGGWLGWGSASACSEPCGPLVAVEGYEEDSLFWCDLSSPIW